MVARPDHAHALHLATSTRHAALLDDLTVSADAIRSLSRSLDRRLDSPRVVQVKVHALFLTSRKIRTFKFS